MGYGSHAVNKLDYARFLAASLCYLANVQRDAAGLIVFDDDVRNYVAPSTPPGPVVPPAARHREGADRHAHRLRQAVRALPEFPAAPRHRGGDFGFLRATRNVIVKTVEPLRFRGNEVILFHVLDPQEIAPKFREPVLLVDMENSGTALEVSPEYARNEYRPKIDAHIEALRDQARGAGMDYFLMDTGRPLDEGLREYLERAPGEDVNGLPGAMVSGRPGGGGAARLAAPAAQSTRPRRCLSAR